MALGSEDIQRLVNEAEHICLEASSVLDKSPFCDQTLVTLCLRKLNALVSVLNDVDVDSGLNVIIERLIAYVLELIGSLDAEQRVKSETQPNPQPSNDKVGRPRYAVDINAAVSLHELGLSWKIIAKTFGIARSTIYNHLHYAGIAPTRPAHTDISDSALDEIMKTLTNEHPFSGVHVLAGHLESRGIHISIRRVNESLRRVDADGISRRQVTAKIVQCHLSIVCC